MNRAFVGNANFKLSLGMMILLVTTCLMAQTTEGKRPAKWLDRYARWQIKRAVDRMDDQPVWSLSAFSDRNRGDRDILDRANLFVACKVGKLSAGFQPPWRTGDTSVRLRCDDKAPTTSKWSRSGPYGLDAPNAAEFAHSLKECHRRLLVEVSGLGGPVVFGFWMEEYSRLFAQLADACGVKRDDESPAPPRQ